jgi:hypothetical protein
MEAVGRALVSGRILEEIELVVVFSVPPLAGWDDLCDNLLA